MHAKPAGFESPETGQNLLKVISGNFPVKNYCNQENDKISHKQRENIYKRDI